MSKRFEMIAGVCHNRGLGFEGSIPWKCSADMKHFRQTTRTAREGLMNAIVMGRITWESFGGRALPKRLNVVLTRNWREFECDADNVVALPSLEHAAQYLSKRTDLDKWYIIGGAKLYAEAIEKDWCSRVILTQIDTDEQCDVFFPEIPDYYDLSESTPLGSPKEGEPSCMIHTYVNRYAAHYEQAYMNEMARLITIPPIVGRNGPVHTEFQWEYTMDLQDGIPLFSTRRGFWKGICQELLFFIHGRTDARVLSNKGVRIWDGNTTREFLDSRGLKNYDVGDMGPMYGWVWRHYGAEYRGMEHDYAGEGFDQLRDLVDKILNDPTSRRMLLTVYDPSKVCQSVLAPCHSIATQFYVREEAGEKYLDMFTFQRSADMFLGVFFNIPSNALLLSILAQACGLLAGKLTTKFGNCHVYAEHVDAVKQQLERTPSTRFPNVLIKDMSVPDAAGGVDAVMEWIESITYEDIKLLGYEPQGRINAPMIA